MSEFANWLQRTINAIQPYWTHILALLLAMLGGAIGFMNDVAEGQRRWSFVLFTLEVISSAFFGMVTYLVFAFGLHLSPVVSSAFSGIMGSVGSRQIRKYAGIYIVSILDYVKLRIQDKIRDLTK